MLSLIHIYLAEIGEKILDNYATQVLDHGFFHADPHPGNILVRGGKIVYIDLGIMGRLSPRDRAGFGNIIQAVGMESATELKEALLSFAASKDNAAIDHTRFLADLDLLLKDYGSCDVSEIDIGQFLNDVFIDVYKRQDQYNTYRAPAVRPAKKQIAAAEAAGRPTPAAFELGEARPVENPHDLFESEYRQQYRSLPFWKRSVILVAGVAMNLLFAILLFIVWLCVIGMDVQLSLIHIFQVIWCKTNCIGTTGSFVEGMGVCQTDTSTSGCCSSCPARRWRAIWATARCV